MADSSYFNQDSVSSALGDRYEDVAGNPFVDAMGFARRFAGGVVRRAQRLQSDIQSGASQAYAQADRSLGGWLPGGGTPNLLTSGYDRPSGRVAAIARSVGVSPDSFRVANLGTKRPFLNQLAYSAGSNNRWRHAAYAFNDPFAGRVIGLNPTDSDRATIVHELGHLQGPPIPDLGRVIQTASNITGGFFPLKYAAGLALGGDAAAEDAAERFTMQHTGTTANMEPLLPDGTSAYGNSLRRQGRELIQESTQPLRDFVSKIQSGYRDFTQAGNVKNWIEAERSGDINRLRYAHTVKNQLLNSGYTEDDLYKIFTEDLKRNPPRRLF